MRELLRENKNFRYFWIAISISRMGDFIDDVAFAQLIYLVTKSTLVTSYVFAIKIILTFFSVCTATIVDKCNKKRILINTSLGQGIVLCFLFLLYKGNYLNTFILIAFVTVQTVFSTFSIPAENAILPCVVSKEDILNARSVMSIFMQFIQIFAYVCSGGIIVCIGIKGAILFDVVTFLSSALLMKCVCVQKEKAHHVILEETFFKDVKQGFQFVLTDKIIFAVMFVTFLGNMLTAPVESLMPAYFFQGLYNEYAYSIFMIGIAVGSIMGSYILTKIQKKFRRNVLLSIGFLFGAIGIIMLYFNCNLIPYIASVFMGISNGWVSIINATVIQLKTPKDMIARTFSIFKCLSYIAGPVGVTLAGWLGEIIKMNLVFLPFGILLLITSVLTIKVVTN